MFRLVHSMHMCDLVSKHFTPKFLAISDLFTSAPSLRLAHLLLTNIKQLQVQITLRKRLNDYKLDENFPLLYAC